MQLRHGLPELPRRMRSLPLDHRGYPIPWFVAFIDGKPDFRVVKPNAIAVAVNNKLCWLCGAPMGRFGAFVIGPMCAVNRVSSEPPSHRDCAIFAAKACPFLTRPNAERRLAGLPGDAIEPAGVGLKRNPGACCVWVSTKWSWFEVSNGYLCDVGDPVETLWFAEGRPATRAECLASIESGLPLLMDGAPDDPKERAEGMAALEKALARAKALLPLESTSP